MTTLKLVSESTSVIDKDERLDSLKTNGRGVDTSLARDLKLYHRFPSSFYVEGKVVGKCLRIPGQSVTLDCYGIEEDALLKINDSDDRESAFEGIAWGCGVLYLTVEQVEGWTYEYDIGKGKQKEAICCSLKVNHVPYPWNYAHGELQGLSNSACVENFPRGGRKKCETALARIVTEFSQVLFLSESCVDT